MRSPDDAFAAGHRPARLTISDRWEDVSVALALVHDSFVEAGYMTPAPSGHRMILPYLNPGTSFFLARRAERSIGASALIADGPLGLPADRSFAEEIDELRREGRPLSECGSLVVDSAWRGESTLIVAQLMAGAARVLEEREDAHVVVSVTPSAERFYAALFGFQRLAEPRPLYGAPAILMETDTQRVRESVARGRTAPQRLVGELMNPDWTDWIDDRRSGEPWPPGPVTELLAEQRLLERVLGPLAVLSDRLGWQIPERPWPALAVPATAGGTHRSP